MPPITAELSATDRTRTGIWTEVYRPDAGGAMGFSVHTVCDFFGNGELREAVVTTLGAGPDELILRYAAPREAPWELRQSLSGYPAVIEGPR